MLFDDSVVRGFWKEGKHTMLVKDEVQVVKNGAVWPDKKKSSVKGMVAHPEFHGYFKKDYIASYIYMTKMAAQMYKKNKYLKTTSSFEKQVKKAAQKGIKEFKIKGKEQKAAFIYGMALHTAADTFSHSTTGVSGQNRAALKKKTVKYLASKWGTIKHGPKNKKTGKYYAKKNMADSPKCIPSRYQKGAKRLCNAIINQAVVTHKVASNKAFQTVSYYKSAASAKN